VARKAISLSCVPAVNPGAAYRLTQLFVGCVCFWQVRKMKGLKRGRDKLVEAEREKAESAKAARGAQ
jgi:hypothetical protein